MKRYIIQRLLALIPVLAIVAVLTFALIHIAPGGPAAAMLGERATQRDIDQLNHELGLDRPLPVQFVNWLAGAVRGDLGRSLITQELVTVAILNRLEPTLLLGILSMSLAVVIGVPLGILAAVHWKQWLDRASILVVVFGLSVPSFWIAITLVYLFAVALGWFPALGYRELARSDHPWEPFRYLVLPAIALTLGHIGLIARMARSSMLEALQADYIRTAQAKGLHQQIVIYRHALKNALLPVITVIGLGFSGFASGTVIIEVIFALPGVGRLMYSAVSQRDYPVVQGVLLYAAIVYVFINFVVDLLYAAVDPRVKYS